jgi:flagellar hook-basal body complex protein FliE
VIESIDAVQNISALKPTLELQALDVQPTQNFVIDGLQSLNESIRSADQVFESMALNESVSAHEVMLAMEGAKMELRMVVEVRNKLLESYQELMRMQV